MNARCLVTALAGLLLGSVALAQAPGQRASPRIGYVYPAGGARGTVVQLTIGGENLNETSAVHTSIPGATARIAGFDRPLTQREFNDAREQLQQLTEKRAATRARAADQAAASWTKSDEARLEELRRLVQKRPNRILTPALRETVTVELTLPAEAPTGPHELRLEAAAGLSNPMAFHLGTLPEQVSPVVSATTNYTDFSGAPRLPTASPSASAAVVAATALPIVINGQILPGEVDRIRFSARRGQRITLATAARALIPYLADAVPGWFQPVLTVRDAAGRELAFCDDFKGQPDPVLLFEPAADGEFTAELRDAIYRGREDFVYRLAIGELPFVSGFYPLGGKTGERISLHVSGANLPRETLVVDARTYPSGIFSFAAGGPELPSNRVLFSLARLDHADEQEPNDTGERAQRIPPPHVVNGRLQTAGDRDVFRFRGTAGATWVFETFARRLGSPADTVITLRQADGTLLGRNDDTDDPTFGLLAHQADSYLRTTLPSDGEYLLTVEDGANAGTESHAYQLHIRPPQPDFALRFSPSTLNVRGGACTPVAVHVLRRDGFDGEIRLFLRDAPPGFALSGGRIPAGCDQVRLTLSAPATPGSAPVPLTMVGVAESPAGKFFRVAAPAEDMMQAFFYRHLVPARQGLAAIRGRGSVARVLDPLPLQLPIGGTARVRLGVRLGRSIAAPEAELIEPPAGISVRSVRARGDSLEIELAADSAAKPGAGNLLLHVTGDRPGGPPAKAGTRSQRPPLTSVPAIPYDLVPARARSS